MIMHTTFCPGSRRRLLWEAATDFYWLQNRGYPRLAALEWVGNRYALDGLERELLRRGVFAQKIALARRAKRSTGSDWRHTCLAVDGHNVHITVESALLGRPMVKGNDGAVRDLAGLSSRFRMTEITDTVLDSVMHSLAAIRPPIVHFLFDAPMSRSGDLATRYRERMRALGLAGEARAVPVPERELVASGCVLATSDGGLLDSGSRWIDLAARCLQGTSLPFDPVDFSSLLLTRPEASNVLVPGDPC